MRVAVPQNQQMCQNDALLNSQELRGAWFVHLRLAPPAMGRSMHPGTRNTRYSSGAAHNAGSPVRRPFAQAPVRGCA